MGHLLRGCGRLDRSSVDTIVTGDPGVQRKYFSILLKRSEDMKAFAGIWAFPGGGTEVADRSGTGGAAGLANFAAKKSSRLAANYLSRSLITKMIQQRLVNSRVHESGHIAPECRYFAHQR